MTEKSKSSY